MGGASLAARSRTDFGLSQIDASASIASVASAGKIGELFQYSVGSVSLPRQRSAMLPIITDPIQVERLSIYNPTVLPKNPLTGARIKNTTGKHLLQGPITVLEGSSYAGDAKIDNLPPGQERLISYGIDLQMLMDASHNQEEQKVVTLKISKGVLNIQGKRIFTQTYIAQNNDEKDKTLIIEHPRRQNWELLDSPKPIETTDVLYRFQQPVPAGKKQSLTVKEQIVEWGGVGIMEMDAATIATYVSSDSTPKPVKDALAKAAALKAQVVESERKVKQFQSQRQVIVADQPRIREDIKAVEKGPYQTSMITKLQEQEKQLEEIDKNLDATQKTLEKQRKDLEDYISALEIG
jgi:hypothetical protein